MREGSGRSAQGGRGYGRGEVCVTGEVMRMRKVKLNKVSDSKRFEEDR